MHLCEMCNKILLCTSYEFFRVHKEVWMNDITCSVYFPHQPVSINPGVYVLSSNNSHLRLDVAMLVLSYILTDVLVQIRIVFTYILDVYL